METVEGLETNGGDTDVESEDEDYETPKALKIATQIVPSDYDYETPKISKRKVQTDEDSDFVDVVDVTSTVDSVNGETIQNGESELEQESDLQLRKIDLAKVNNSSRKVKKAFRKQVEETRVVAKERVC